MQGTPLHEKKQTVENVKFCFYRKIAVKTHQHSHKR